MHIFPFFSAWTFELYWSDHTHWCRCIPLHCFIRCLYVTPEWFPIEVPRSRMASRFWDISRFFIMLPCPQSSPSSLEIRAWNRRQIKLARVIRLHALLPSPHTLTLPLTFTLARSQLPPLCLSIISHFHGVGKFLICFLGASRCSLSSWCWEIDSFVSTAEESESRAQTDFRWAVKSASVPLCDEILSQTLRSLREWLQTSIEYYPAECSLISLHYFFLQNLHRNQNYKLSWEPFSERYHCAWAGTVISDPSR